jgi:flagellar hook protein FlgE
MSFQQGLSGLNAASKSLDVTGNNVANSSTVGFKSGQAQFADVYAASLNGSGASQVGIGVKVSTVAQQFTQGNVTSTNNPLDLAINGAGFFRMDNNGVTTYTRNGQFTLDKTGYVVNAQGLKLTGYIANAKGVLQSGAPTDLIFNTADLAPQSTSNVGLLVNLDSREALPATAVFSATDPTSYNQSTSISVFDTLGNSHLIQSFFKKTASNTWDVYGTSDGVPLTTPKIGTLVFSSSGALTSPQPFVASATVSSGAVSPLVFNVDFTGSSQYGSTFGLNKPIQDGYTSGKLSGFTTGADGIITGRYTNGKSATLGQVVLANFTDPNGLVNLGNNAWAETAASGGPLVGAPSSGSLGVLQSSAVEDSNVDLTAELVNLITAQRFYQANAQTIKTQDQVLQTLVNLR